MSYLSCDTLDRVPLERDPFDYVVVQNFISHEALEKICADFPEVPGTGSYPPSELRIVGHFAGLLDELNGETFRKAVESKFSIDLGGAPTMATVRGHIGRKDGFIHTDSKTKLITVLLYFNDSWAADGGRLRLLRNGTDLENYAVEVPPEAGTLIVFRRANNSWHGHKRYDGPRRAIQFNWVTSQDVVEQEQARHRFSTRLKKLTRIFARPARSDAAAA
jgi:SM-20-related protein